jgi:uncharacterized protein YecE (DUF72 family)
MQKGIFYPSDLPASKMLPYYAERFKTVEINNTFYRMPKEEMLRKWTEQVPADFTFVLKASQSITHFKRLKEVEQPVSYLLEQARALGSHLGPIFYQLPPNMKKDLARLQEFLGLLPPLPRSALEFRHESWFADDVYDALRAANIAICISDADDESTPVVSTADWGYLRLRRSAYDSAALDSWTERVLSQGWTTAFTFFKHEDEARGPAFANDFLKLLP